MHNLLRAVLRVRVIQSGESEGAEASPGPPLTLTPPWLSLHHLCVYQVERGHLKWGLTNEGFYEMVTL